MAKTILYARVSTSEQTSAHQLKQARKAGFEIKDEDVVTDHGTSGVSTKLAEREGGQKLLYMLRGGDTLVVRWLDRLGRNYRDVTDTLRELLRRGVTVKTVINGQTFEAQPKSATDEAVRDALIGFMAAQAEAQALATKEAQAAGIAHHKAISPEKFKGRKPTFSRDQFEQVKALLEAGQSHSAIGKAIGVHRNTVIRIANDPARVDAALTRWEKKTDPSTAPA